MLLKLAALLIIVPLLELFVLIPLASQIGVLPTIAIVVVTGLIGAWLAKRQGLDAWRRLKSEVGTGALPHDAIFDGVAILIACALLLAPGVLTDIAGVVLLVPAARRPLKGYLKQRFIKMLQNSNRTVIDVRSYGGPEPRYVEDDVIDMSVVEERHPA